MNTQAAGPIDVHRIETTTRPAGPGLLGTLISTERDYTALLLRLTLALVIFPHGAQKLLGWFGGFGFTGTMGFFTETMGLSTLVGLLVILIEFFGPIALAAGAFSRIAAAGIAAVMIGAVVTTHLPYGFFMDWNGTLNGEGFEYHILAIGISAAIFIKGSGALSVDRWVSQIAVTPRGWLAGLAPEGLRFKPNPKGGATSPEDTPRRRSG